MRELVLTQGMVTVVDDEDFERFNKFKWCAEKNKKRYYAVRIVGSSSHQIKQYLHREILNIPKGVKTDHRNGNGLDNRRENLRPCTTQENARNQRNVISGKSSKFKGVCWDKNKIKWRSTIEVDGNQIYLGRFTDELEAAHTYDAAARKIFGEFAAPNFT